MQCAASVDIPFIDAEYDEVNAVVLIGIQSQIAEISFTDTPGPAETDTYSSEVKVIRILPRAETDTYGSEVKRKKFFFFY